MARPFSVAWQEKVLLLLGRLASAPTIGTIPHSPNDCEKSSVYSIFRYYFSVLAFVLRPPLTICRAYFWLCPQRSLMGGPGDSMVVHGSNLVQLCSRKVPSLPYYLSNPFISLYTYETTI